MKPSSWRRYDASQRAYNAFHAEAYPAKGVPAPPYDTVVVAEWVGDMVARGLCSAATAVAALSKHHVNGGGVPLRDSVAIQ